MGELLSYSIVSGLSMLAMYLAYRLFLARENQHGFNRGVLLGIYLVSFLSPGIFLELENLSLRQLSGGLTFEATGNAETLVAAQSTPVWGTVMIWIYIAGMAAVAVRTAVVWIRLSNVIRRENRRRRLHAGCDRQRQVRSVQLDGLCRDKPGRL